MIGEPRRRHAKSKAVAYKNAPQPKVENGEADVPVPPMSAHDASSYILGMAAELRRLAEASGFRFLAYLLEMVFQEAFRLTADHDDAGREEKPARGVSSGRRSTG